MVVDMVFERKFSGGGYGFGEVNVVVADTVLKRKR